MGYIYQNANQLLMQELIEIYKLDRFDWLSYQITKSNTLTLHHIVKQCDGGLTIISNSAPLTKKAQRGLHMCESRDLTLYLEINDFFKYIIMQGTPLDEYLMGESRKYKNALSRVLYKK